MPGDYFWQCVQALAVTFDGDITAAEENLTVYEMHARQFTPERRAEARRDMVCVIGGLSRLETRLADFDAGQAG
jgi:hypothetical protein